MKYYAVTNDPRELYHYGVKGMKWGQHLFGDDLRPKSQAFKRAAAKLRNNMRSGLENLSKSRATHQRQKQLKAARKARDRINYIEGMNRYDNERAYAKQLNRDLKQQQKQQKWMQKQAGLESKTAANSAYVSYKNAKRAAKIEKRMDKIMKQARQGKLKYGKLSSEQIERVQDRLNLENQTRKLGSQEKTWRQQKKEARRAGQLQGITRGTAAVMEEVARAGAQVGIKHILDRRKLNQAAKQEGILDKIKNRERNKKTKSEIDEDIKQQAYEVMAKNGESWFTRRAPMTIHDYQANVKAIEDQKRLTDAQNAVKTEYEKKLFELTNYKTIKDQKRLADAQNAVQEEYDKKFFELTNDLNVNDEDIQNHYNLSKREKHKYNNDAEYRQEVRNRFFVDVTNDLAKRYDQREQAKEKQEQYEIEQKKFDAAKEVFKKDHRAWEKEVLDAQQEYQQALPEYNKLRADRDAAEREWNDKAARNVSMGLAIPEKPDIIKHPLPKLEYPKVRPEPKFNMQPPKQVKVASYDPIVEKWGKPRNSNNNGGGSKKKKN